LTPSGLARKSDLKVEADCKLQLPHRGAALQAGDLPVVAALAVDTRVRPVVGTERVYGVIEHIEGIHAELRTEFLANREYLHDRKVGIKSSRAMEGVTADVAQLTRPRILKSSRAGDDICNGRKERYRVSDRIEITRTHVEGTRPLTRTADVDVLFVAAFAKGRCPWEPAAPVGGIA
jgi:hypothetical protein